MSAQLGLEPGSQPRHLKRQTVTVAFGGLELSLGTPGPLGGGGQILGESVECRLHSFQGLGEGHKLAAGFGYRLDFLQILAA